MVATCAGLSVGVVMVIGLWCLGFIYTPLSFYQAAPTGALYVAQEARSPSDQAFFL